MTQPNSQFDGPRGCTHTEVHEVVAMVNAEMRANSDQSLLTDYPLVYRHTNVENIRILKVDNALASVVPFIPWNAHIEGCPFRFAIISPTATAPHHRKKGFGLRCALDCVQKMTAAHCHLATLWTREATFPFYEHAQFHPIASQGYAYSLQAADAPRFAATTDEISDAPPTQEDLERIARLNAAHNSGLIRTTLHYEALFHLPKVRTLIARRAGEFAAYLVVSHATNKPGILEGGGLPDALESLLQHAVKNIPPDKTLDASTPLAASSYGDLLARNLPDRRQPMKLGQMMRLNDPAAFLTSLAPHLAAKNAGRIPAFSLTIDGQTIGLNFHGQTARIDSAPHPIHHTLSRQQATALFFGTHPSRPFAPPPELQHLFPLYLPISVLDRS